MVIPIMAIYRMIDPMAMALMFSTMINNYIYIQVGFKPVNLTDLADFSVFCLINKERLNIKAAGKKGIDKGMANNSMIKTAIHIILAILLIINDMDKAHSILPRVIIMVNGKMAK